MPCLVLVAPCRVFTLCLIIAYFPLLGLLYRDILTYKDEVYLINNTEDFTLYTKDTSGCVTLGRYIFISSRADSDTVKHEVGHVKQS